MQKTTGTKLSKGDCARQRLRGLPKNLNSDDHVEMSNAAPQMVSGFACFGACRV